MKRQVTVSQITNIFSALDQKWWTDRSTGRTTFPSLSHSADGPKKSGNFSLQSTNLSATLHDLHLQHTVAALPNLQSSEQHVVIK